MWINRHGHLTLVYSPLVDKGKKVYAPFMLNRYITVILLIFVILAILIFSLFINPPRILIKGITYADKIWHGSAYAVLGFLLYFSFRKKGDGLKLLLLTVFITTLYGGVLEIIQGYMGRTPDLADLMADTLGGACGALVVYIYFKRQLKKAGKKAV